MSTAVAERGLDGRLAVLTGDTDPAEAVHDTVIETMADVGVDRTEQSSRRRLADRPYFNTI
ncbi:hypothetical protein [Halorhabdus sp. CUG00001]|uniref:hypothetical protein n=1 Tax=Halorhabdus sp. CUG00001 TaxID=2600297 RepID=UPI00131B4E64|nr:hypothetical protein [Halorhabdus sp. CUG00001]